MSEQWTEHFDAGGTLYYVNTLSGESSWNKPAHQEHQKQSKHHTRVSTQLPAEWNKHRNENGERYYSNQQGESTWTAPAGATGGSTGVETHELTTVTSNPMRKNKGLVDFVAKSKHHTRVSTQMPAEWQKHRDDQGRRYYSDQQGVSSWTAPAGATGGSTGVARVETKQYEQEQQYNYANPQIQIVDKIPTTIKTKTKTKSTTCRTISIFAVLLFLAAAVAGGLWMFPPGGRDAEDEVKSAPLGDDLAVDLPRTPSTTLPSSGTTPSPATPAETVVVVLKQSLTFTGVTAAELQGNKKDLATSIKSALGITDPTTTVVVTAIRDVPGRRRALLAAGVEVDFEVRIQTSTEAGKNFILGIHFVSRNLLKLTKILLFSQNHNSSTGSRNQRKHGSVGGHRQCCYAVDHFHRSIRGWRVGG